jgi:hypothetical protein
MDVQNGHAAWSSSIKKQHGQATWTNSMDMKHGDINMEHGH